MSKINKLRITGLPLTITEDDLRKIFSNYGQINVVFISPTELKGTKNAFIVYEDEQSVTQAINELNYSEINGNLVKLTYGDEQTLELIKSGQNRIMVQGLDIDIPEKAVYEAFSHTCKVLYCSMATASTGKYLGICLLTYRTKEECDTVIKEMNGCEVGGKTLTVKYAPSLNK